MILSEHIDLTGEAHHSAIRVLICDDSSVARASIARILRAEAGIEIVGCVDDGAAAVQTLKQVGADVIVLDVEMPVMDGITALPRLLEIDPTVRIIVVSAMTTSGAGTALKAIRCGAVDYLHKPEAETREEFARQVRTQVLAYGRRGKSTTRSRALPTPLANYTLRERAFRKPSIIAIGSSTGGPQALFQLFNALDKPFQQPFILTQHMPPVFTRSLAEHLNRLGHRPCVEAEDGMLLLANRLHVAPGDRHMLIERSGDGFRIRLSDGPAENSCRPSVDPMLRSAAQATDGTILVVILTGMGRDGASGSQHVVSAGGTVLAQDEASSVVWGMPGVVARDGLCHAVLPIGELADRVTKLAHGG